MKKKLFILLAVILLAAFAVTVGAYLSKEPVDQNTMTETDVAKKFDDYYAARVQNVGNNSEVINLMNILGAGDFGEYTIALQTKTKPYGLTILYSKLKNGADEAKLKTLGRIDYAFYALALIDNLSTVNVKYKTFNYKLTVDEANKIIGGNIKDYGKSSDKLKELYEKLNPED